MGFVIWSSAAVAQPDASRWDALAIGLTLAPATEEVASPPPGIDPGLIDPGGLPDADPQDLVACNSFLQDFLANTEYLGPLIDFLTCTSGGALDVLAEQLMGVSELTGDLGDLADQLRSYVVSMPANASSYVGKAAVLCSLNTGASKVSATWFEATGNTRCMPVTSLLSTDAPVAVSGQVKVVNFLNGKPLQSSANRNGTGRVFTRVWQWNPNANRLLKTKYSSQMELDAPACAGGDCRYAWLVLTNKNPNTGTTPQCSTPTGAGIGRQLNCVVDSLPFSQKTLR